MKNKNLIAYAAKVCLSVCVFTMLSSCREDDPDPNDTRGITADSAYELIDQLDKDYKSGTVDENLLATSIDYDRFCSFMSQVYSCSNTSTSTSIDFDAAYYRKYFGNSRALEDNQSCALITVGYMLVSATADPIFLPCSSGVIVFECNRKTGKYYVIECKNILS